MFGYLSNNCLWFNVGGKLMLKYYAQWPSKCCIICQKE